jgi:two-component system sensor histidine kinase VanS
VLTSVRTRFTLAYAILLAGTGVALVSLFYTYIGVAGVVAVGVRPASSTEPAPSAVVEPSAPADPLLTNVGFVSLAVLIVAVAMWLGWLIAGRLLRPLDAIHRTARQVAQGDLSPRAEVLGPDDEFAELTRVFNRMLDRIELSLEAHRRFGANASHELRTPLATNKAMLTVALDQPDDSDLVELARRLQIVNQHSIDTVEALLDLAEAEQPVPNVERVDLAEIVRNGMPAVGDEARASGLAVTIHLLPAPVVGSRVLLTRVIANLLHNAVRHNVLHGSVDLQTAIIDGRAQFAVTNTGPDVPESLVETLTEPFVRQAGRTAATSAEGVGLGLAIVTSITRAHGGEFELTRVEGGGLTARFSLPADVGAATAMPSVPAGRRQ